MNTVVKYLLRYLIFVGIPYTISKKIEKKYLENLKSLNNTEDKPDNLDVDISKKYKLDTRGGELLTISAIIGFLMKDLPFRVALTGLIATTIWSDTADSAVELVVKHAGAIAAASGLKFKNIIKKLRNIDDRHTLDIKEILLEKTISNKEKLELLRIKIQYVLKNLKGTKKITFITTVIALLTFFLGNNTPAYAYFMAGLRDLLGGKDDIDSIRNLIIDIYREYNAPLPEELITKIIDEL